MNMTFILKRAAAGILLLIGGNAGAEWSTQSVDNTANAGLGVSLVLNPTTGSPAISYIRPTAGFSGFFDIAYSVPGGATWTQETVYSGTNGPGEVTSIALTDQGNPVLSYTRSSTFIYYANRSGGSWSSQLVSNAGGNFSSLVWRGTEATPDPAVAFYDGTAGDLKYGYTNNNSFATTTLDPTNAGASCSMAQSGSTMGIAYIRGGKLGYFESPNSGQNWGAYSDNAFAPFNAIDATYCSLALAPSVNRMTPGTAAHIIYYYLTSGKYRYVTNDTATGTWTTPEDLTTASLQTVSYSGLSIAVGSDGVPCVAFLDYGTKTLQFAKRTATGWSAPETVDAAPGGITCSLRLTAANLPRIAYGTITFDSGSSSYVPSGVKYATFANPVALSFTVSGKTKRISSKPSIKITGSASSSAIAVEWRIGKKAFKRVSVAGGKWKATCKPLKLGPNRVEFRAISASGMRTAIQRITVTVKK